MPGQTTHGLPYPVGTDRVMDGDDAIKALAQAVDSTRWGPAGAIQTAVQANPAVGWVRLTGAATEDPALPMQSGMTFQGAAATLTVPVAGVYLVWAMASFGTGTAGTAGRRNVGIALGTATTPQAGQFSGTAWGANSSGQIVHTVPMLLAAGAVLSAWFYTDVAQHVTGPAGRLAAVQIA